MSVSENSVGKVLGTATPLAGGAVMLPNTAGNSLGRILAYTAIAIGLTALFSQILVRVARRIYQ